MDKQTNPNRQTRLIFTALASLVLMFAATSAAVAQGKYKIGDRVECDANLTGVFKKGTVVPYAADDYNPANINGKYYRVRFDGNPIAEGYVCQPEHMRPLGEGAPAKPQGDAENQASGQPNNQSPASPQTTGINKYGTRDPRTCASTKAPARGAITAAVAKQYVICERENINRSALHLVENVNVEVGRGRAFQPQSDLNFTEIDVRSPIYSLRGSLSAYACEQVDSNRAHSGYNVGTNCSLFEERKATGVCYKTTFGDWRCNMNGVSAMATEDQHFNVAPPK